jgi:hypothetical protein
LTKFFLLVHPYNGSRCFAASGSAGYKPSPTPLPECAA